MLCTTDCFLQDSTRYDKTQKLLEKYDPEYVPSSPSRGFSNSTHFAPPTTPGLRHRQMSNMQAQSNPGMMSPLAGTCLAPLLQVLLLASVPSKQTADMQTLDLVSQSSFRSKLQCWLVQVYSGAWGLLALELCLC